MKIKYIGLLFVIPTLYIANTINYKNFISNVFNGEFNLEKLKDIGIEVGLNILRKEMYKQEYEINKLKYISNISNYETIKEIFKIASFSYCNESNLIKNLNIIDDNHILLDFVNNNSLKTLVIIVYDELKDRIIISYRGSNSPLNWLYNIMFSQVTPIGMNNKAKVHKGFYELFNSTFNELKEKLIKILKIQKYFNSKIYVTGHSLGAGLSSIASYYIFNILYNYSFNNIMYLITYCGPRFGNFEAIKEIVDKKYSISRVVKNNDIISQIPLKNNDYLHLPNEINIYSNNKIKLCDNYYDESPNCQLKNKCISKGFDEEAHENLFDMNLKSFCILKNN